MDLSKYINTNFKIRVDPFLHCVVENFFSAEIYNQIKADYDIILSKNLAEQYSTTNFYKFSHYDAYCYIPKQDNTAARAFFYSKEWKNFISTIFSREDLSDDVLLEYHYHKPNGEAGEIHSDDEQVCFPLPEKESTEFLRAFDGSVSYRGVPNEKTITRRRTIVAILYLNDGWIPENKGQTALYRDPNDEPFLLVEPKGNTLLLFEIGEESWHRSLSLGNKERKTICFWFHT